MATMTIRMPEEEAAVAKRYAEFSGMTFSDFARKAINDAIEDHCDVAILERAIREDDGRRVSHADVMKEFDL